MQKQDYYIRSLRSNKWKSSNPIIDCSTVEKYLNDAKESKKMPFVIKDNFCTKNMVTTCGSKLLLDYLPSYDAHVVNLLENKNIFRAIGKCSLDEFGCGNFGINSSVKIATNSKYGKEFCAGGSSSGIAAIVNDDAVPL